MAACHIRKNLAALRQFPRVALNNIRDLPEAFKPEHRKGRGRGSGRGKTSGRGHKGQGQRNTKPRLGFEGGNTPFYIRVPKHGFKNVYKKIYSPLNLNRLQFFVDSGRINPKEPITMFHLWRSGAIAGRIKDGVTLLGGGTTWFQAKLDIEVSRASKTAIKAIERQGGKITCGYYNKLGLRLLLKPEKFEGRRIPRRARPPRKLMEYYTSVENRGYLADPVELENARLQTYKLENEVD